MKIIIIFFVGYVCGLLQPAYVFGKIVGKTDIRRHGSNNAGASNVTIMLGWKYGVLTAVIDGLKALVPILILRFVLHESIFWWFVVGFGAIIGHVFPFYLKFKGGKGTASFVGMMIGIQPLLGLILLVVLAIVTILTGYIAIGTYSMMIICPILLYFLDYSWECIGVAIAISLISLYKHIPNLIKIARKEERTLKSVIKKK